MFAQLPPEVNKSVCDTLSCAMAQKLVSLKLNGKLAAAHKSSTMDIFIWHSLLFK